MLPPSSKPHCHDLSTAHLPGWSRMAHDKPTKSDGNSLSSSVDTRAKACIARLLLAPLIRTERAASLSTHHTTRRPCSIEVNSSIVARTANSSISQISWSPTPSSVQESQKVRSLQKPNQSHKSSREQLSRCLQLRPPTNRPSTGV